MKRNKIIIASVLAIAAGATLASCSVDFDCPPVVCPDLGGDGGWEAPLTVEGATAYYTAYYSEDPDTEKYYWVTGYIVGCVNTTETVFTATDQTAALSAPFESTSNMLIASDPNETDYEKCISVQLPSGDVRNALNLNENPSNKGKQVSLRGYIDKYVGLPGLRSVTHYNWGTQGVDTGDVETEKSLFTYTQTITSGRSYALVADNSAAQTVTAAGGSGFLYTSSVTISNKQFTASEQLGFLFIEAVTGSGQYYMIDYKGLFLYQGVYGSGYSNRPTTATAPVKDDNSFLWQPELNADGHFVITNVASGQILAYDTSYTSYGIYKALSEQYLAPELYEMANEPVTVPDVTPVEPGTGGDTDVDEGTGEGTLSSPYDIARALAIINSGAASTSKVYLTGIISQIDNIDTSYGNATYYLSDDGTTAKQLQVYRGYGLDGAKFTSTDALKVGDKLVIYGQLVLYNTTPEVTTGSSIVSINGEGTQGGGSDDGGDDSGDSGTESTILSSLGADDANGAADWTFDNVNLPSAASYIWIWKEYNGSYYLNGSAYVGGANESEAYAYTTLDLSGKSSATLTFEHAAKFQTTLLTHCGLVVRESGTSTWSTLTIPTWPEAGSWTFVSSGEVDLSAYAGKKLEIGFKYGSTSSGADTWEIKNFIVKGK